MKRHLFSILFIFVVSTHANASGWITDDGTARITFVNTESIGVRLHYTADTSKNPDNCQNNSHLVLRADNPLFEQHYSLLLSAFMAKKPLKFFANGCFEGWGTSYPIISAIYVYD